LVVVDIFSSGYPFRLAKGARQDTGTIATAKRAGWLRSSAQTGQLGSKRFTPLVLYETGNAGQLDKACLHVLSPGAA
jgi:hypothetical protein